MNRLIPILLLCALLLPAQSSDGKSAWDLFRERDYERALQALKKDSQLYPRTAAIIDGMGWCEYFLGRHQNAEKLFREALSADAEYKWSKQGLDLLAKLRSAPLEEAAALLNSGDYSGARVIYQRIHDGKTAAGAECFGQASAGEGWCLYYLAQYDEAIRCFQRAWKEQNNLTDAQRGIAWCLYAKGGYVDALAALRHVLKAEPTDLNARLTAGWCFYWRKAWADAEKEFRAALEHHAGNADALSALGWALEQQNDRTGALATFTKAVYARHDLFTTSLRALATQREDWNSLIFEAALGALRQQDNASAATELAALAAKPDAGAQVHLAHAIACLRQGFFAQAAAEIERARSLQADVSVELTLALSDGRSAPTQTDCDCVLGWTLLAQGRTREAAAAFLQAQSRRSQNVEAMLGRGWALHAEGTATEAADQFRNALTALPLCVDARKGLDAVTAWRRAPLETAALTLISDPAATLAACDELLSGSANRFPQEDLDQVQVLKARALLNLQRSPEARDACKAAIALRPQCGPAHKLLMQIALQDGRMLDAASHAAGARTDPRLEKDSEVLTVLAEANAADKLLDKARALYEEAIASGPADAGALASYALFEIEQKHPVEARLLLERALAWDPSRAKDARIAEALRSDPEFDKLHGVLGWAWLTRGDLEQARASFELALTKDPREREALRGHGLALLRQKKIKEAGESLEKYFAQVLSGNARECPWGLWSGALSEWGWAVYSAGQWTEATKIFSRLAALHQGEKIVYADPHVGLGWCALRNQRLEQARKHFLDAVSIQPRCETALQGLEALQVLQLRSAK